MVILAAPLSRFKPRLARGYPLPSVARDNVINHNSDRLTLGVIQTIETYPQKLRLSLVELSRLTSEHARTIAKRSLGAIFRPFVMLPLSSYHFAWYTV